VGIPARAWILRGVIATACAMVLAAVGHAAPAPPPAPSASAGDIGELVVTAEKREENVQKVPLSIAVVKGEQLQGRGVDTLFDAAPLVSGMVFSRAPDDGLSLTFRGLGTPARNQSFDQSIALFIDGAFVGKGRLYGSNIFDVDRVEFIKSSESTLLGKNTDVGAISLVTRGPGAVYAASVSAGLELEHRGYLLDAGVDLPLGDKLAVRIAGHLVDTDGWVRNSYNGLWAPIDKNDGLRVTAVLTPAAAMKFTLVYQFTYDHRIGNGFQYVDPDHVLPPGLGEGALDDQNDAFTSKGEDGESFHRLPAHVVVLTSDFQTGASQVTAITSFITYRMHLIDDFDFGPKDGNVFDRHEDYWQASQELRLASASDRKLSYLLGASIFYSDWNSDELQSFDTPLQVGPVPFDTIFLGSFEDIFKQRTFNVSAFGEATWRITDRLRASAGLRYTEETKRGSWARPAFAPFTLWNEVINPPFPQSPLSFTTRFPDANLSIQFDATNTIMLYAAAGQGTKTGGFAESAQVPTGNPQVDAFVGNETTRSIETGFKSTILGGAAHLNGSLFYTSVPNFQDTDFNGAEFVSSNIPVRSYGAEGEFTWRAERWLTLDSAWTYANAKALLTPSFTPPYSPKLTGYAGALVEFPIAWDDLVVRGSAYVRYRSTMHNLHDPIYRSVGLTTFDLSLGIGPSSGKWEVSLVGTNVTNAISADFAFPLPDPTIPSSVQEAAPSQLRRVLLQVRANF